jgi:fumarylacetoacetate (FAA) hydrolase
MKFASYQDASRDGQLVVVSRDLTQAVYPTHIANRLQQVLDDWNYLSPQLQDLSDLLNAGRLRNAFAFNPAQCLAPLPRAYQWARGGGFASDAPLPVQTSSDSFFGAQDAYVCAVAKIGLDFSAELAVATSDIPQGCSPEKAIEGIRLVLLANHWSLHLLNNHSPKDAGTAFGPVAVTPDELGEAWSQGRVHLTLQSTLNGRKVGLCDTGEDMTHHFGDLIAALASNRKLSAGTLVGSGTVRSPGVEKNGQIDWPKGYHSIAEKRAMETRQDGNAVADFLHSGDAVRIEMKGRDGLGVFGAIAQDVTALTSIA